MNGFLSWQTWVIKMFDAIVFLLTGKIRCSNCGKLWESLGWLNKDERQNFFCPDCSCEQAKVTMEVGRQILEKLE